MAKQMKTWNSYEIVDGVARKDIVGLKEAAGSLVEAVENIPGAIIDVGELPTENIRKDCFYRLVSAESFYGSYNRTEDTVICVNFLPEIGEVITDAEASYLKLYYNIEDNGVYGYVDGALASAFGFPSSGWIDYGTLCAFTGETYNGVITHIDDAKDDGSFRILLSYSLHIYKDGWKELPYAYESAPEFDIKWDGEIGDKFALDLTSLGNPNSYLVKVSDSVFAQDELLGALHHNSDSNYMNDINEDVIDAEIYPGAIMIDGGFVAIVNDAETLNASLGTPSGYITNGTYFFYFTGGESTTPFYTDRLVGKKKISKIDSKFIDVDTDALDNFATVATTGDYNDLVNTPSLHLVATSGSYNDLKNKPTIYTEVIRYNTTQSLSDAAKTRARNNIDVYSKSEVDTKISDYSTTTEVQTMIAEAIGTAIGNAIGGSY